MHREDHHTSTVEDAEAFARMHAVDDDRRPTSFDALDAMNEKASAEAYARRRANDPTIGQRETAIAVRFDLLGAGLGILDVAASTDGLAPPAVRIDASRMGTDLRGAAHDWLVASPRWDAMWRDGVLFARPADGAVDPGPPF